MAIAKVQLVSNSATSASNLTLSITATTGNLLVVVASANVGGTMTISDGVNTWTARNAGSWDNYLWYAENITGGALTITIGTSAGKDWAGQVIEFSGASTTAPIQSWIDGTGVSPTSSGATATAASTGVYVLGAMANNATTTVTARSFTTALSSQTDETQTTGGVCSVLLSHGPIAGLNAEYFTITNSSGAQPDVYCALITPAAGTTTASATVAAMTAAGVAEVADVTANAQGASSGYGYGGYGYGGYGSSYGVDAVGQPAVVTVTANATAATMTCAGVGVTAAGMTVVSLVFLGYPHSMGTLELPSTIQQ